MTFLKLLELHKGWPIALLIDVLFQTYSKIGLQCKTSRIIARDRQACEAFLERVLGVT